MARENNKGGITTVGISSLLTIFAVLCLVVFTLLTVSSARAAQTLSDKAAASVLNYYQADLEAEKTLAQLRAGKVPEGVRQVDGRFCYSHAISQTQTLEVEVAVQGEAYTVLRWQAVSTAEWDSEEKLPVWTGEAQEGST